MLGLLVMLLAPQAHADGFESWLNTQVPRSRRALLANVSPSYASPGAVVASPSWTPNYRFHWVRDGALVMETLVALLEKNPDAALRARIERELYQFVDFSRGNQLTPNPSGGPTDTGLGEPKFHLNGAAFTEGWGRPQSDGPALRASALMRWANRLLDEGKGGYVREKLYSGRIPADTLIKADLEYVSHHWRESSFDLWEEVRGAHFYTRMVQRRALLEGALFAERLNDGGAAAWYRAQAQEIERAIEAHWDPARGYITITLARDGGLDYKHSGLDVGVVLAVLHGGARLAQPDRFFRAGDERVLATALRIRQSFRAIYPVNARETDGEGMALAPAIGRYPEDRYSGYDSGEGNPWFLATNAFAEFHYRLARELQQDGRVRITDRNAPFYRSLRLANGLSLTSGDLIASTDTRFKTLIVALRAEGDAFVRRTRFHADPGGALSEQLNRHSGYMQGAEQLTWSHASMLTCAWERERSF